MRLHILIDIGLLCKLEPVGERSAKCLFVTNQLGKLWTTAFNLAQLKSKLRGILVPPAFLELELNKSKKNFYNLASAQDIDLYPRIKGSLQLNAVSCYLLEVLAATALYDQSEQKILQLTVNTLKALEQGSDIKVMMFNFIWRGLKLHGALPDFASERFARFRKEVKLILQIIKTPWAQIIASHSTETFINTGLDYLYWLKFGNKELEDYIEHKLNSFQFAINHLQ